MLWHHSKFGTKILVPESLCFSSFSPRILNLLLETIKFYFNYVLYIRLLLRKKMKHCAEKVYESTHFIQLTECRLNTEGMGAEESRKVELDECLFL